MTTDYNKLKVTELRDLLKERGIVSTGLTRKQQIVDALEAQDARVSSGSGDDGAAASGDVTAEVVVEEVGDAAGEGEAETGVESEKVEAAVAEVEKSEEKADEKVMHEALKPDEDITDATRPTVLEADQPVSNQPSILATPNQTSPTPDDASSETRKRKRRSVTPPVNADSVSKKLKAAEEDTVRLPEDPAADAMIQDAPAPLEEASDAKDGGEKMVQMDGISDDIMDMKQDAASTELPAASRPAAATPSQSLKPPDAMEVDTRSTRAIHSATRALYIRELIRPIQPNQLRDHLAHLATTPEHEPDLENFHLDTLRTHAFAVFTSISDASRVRAKLHNTVFPDEPTRKPLFVDFVPEEKVQEWIDTELSSGPSRRDAKRWEVVYDINSGDGVRCTLMEVTPTSLPPPGRQSSTSSQPPPAGAGAPNAPLGPRDPRHRPSQTPIPPPPQPQSSSSRSPEQTRHPPTPPTKSFNILDSRFHSTDTKPKLYFLPQPAALASDRLDELQRQTSRNWMGPRRPDFEPAQLRRYTFEDGARLVDNGPDRGSFGVPEFARRGGGGGGLGRGGGRGFRR